MTSELSGFFFQLIAGAMVTLKLAVCSLCLGILFGLIGVIAESSRIRWIRYLAIYIISGIRGLPELLVIFFIYFGGTFLLTQFMGYYVNFSSFTSGVLALALLFGSYASQTFRGAFLAIPVGQIDAGSALGLTQRQLFFHIQLPQAWRHALPGLSNLWLVLLKDTALISLIGLADLMDQAQVAASTTHRPFTFFLITAFFYLLMTSISQIILYQISQKVNHNFEVKWV